MNTDPDPPSVHAIWTALDGHPDVASWVVIDRAILAGYLGVAHISDEQIARATQLLDEWNDSAWASAYIAVAEQMRQEYA